MTWCCEHTSKFPRNYRFVLGERIERNLYDILEWLIEAKYTKECLEILTKINLRLEILRFQFRIANRYDSYRVIRGGSLLFDAASDRAAHRDTYTRTNLTFNYGFRLALSPSGIYK